MIADIVVVAVVAVFAYFGWKRGLMRALMGFLSYIFSIFIAFGIYPHVSAFLKGTVVYTKIVEIIAKNYVSKNIEEKSAEMFGAFSKYLSRGTEALADGISQGIAEIVVNIIAFAAVVIISRLLIWLIGRVLDIFSRLPIIRRFNKAGGALLGGAAGLLVLYIAAAVAVLFVTDNTKIESEIEKSYFAKGIYEDNFILNTIMLDTNKGKEV